MKRENFRFRAGAALGLAVALAAAPASAALFVDINDNDTVASPPGGSPPSPTQAGYTGVTQTGATFANSLGVGGNVTVTFTASGADDRDRGPLSGGGATASSNLARDFVFRAGTAMDTTVGVLKAGMYTFTGYFHDSTVDHGNFDIQLSTTGGPFVVALEDGVYSTGAAPAALGTGTFRFAADGVNNVVFRTINTPPSGTGVAHVINGFDIAPTTGLYVDFNENDAGVSATQAGYFSVTENGATGLDTGFGVVDISLSSFGPAAGNPDRDRGAVTGSPGVSDLARDFVFSQAETLDITISGLDSGRYVFTGYFHDNDVDQGIVDIFYSVDGGATFLDGALDVDYSTGAGATEIGIGTFILRANGVDDVIIRLNNDGNVNNLINGFDLVAIPAPAALPAGLGLMVGAGLRRRRSASRATSRG